MLLVGVSLLGAVALVAAVGGEPHMLRGDVPSEPITLESLGPLQGLLGTWEGKMGLNVVRLPMVEGVHVPQPGVRTASFTTLVQNYSETITFTPIMGAILNRGYQDANQFNPPAMLNQTLMGIMYLQLVHLIEADGSRGPLVHAENGQWQLQVEPGIFPQWTVARFGLIPHSPAIIAVGPTQNLGSGQEILQSLDQAMSNFSSDPLNLGVPGTYATLPGDGGNPVRKLQRDIGSDLDLVNMQAVKLSVGTAGGVGAVSMLRNQRAQVLNRDFQADFWLETVTDGLGSVEFEQLQYAQRVSMNFFANFLGACESHAASANPECVIDWPHIQVNTLRKTQGLDASMGQPLPNIR